MFFRAKIQRPVITYPLHFTSITEKKNSNNEHVRKSLCPTEILWVELLFLFQPESNQKILVTRNVIYEFFFWNWNWWANCYLSPWDFMNSGRSIQVAFLALLRSYGSIRSAYLGITVQGIKSKQLSASKIFME